MRPHRRVQRSYRRCVARIIFAWRHSLRAAQRSAQRESARLHGRVCQGVRAWMTSRPGMLPQGTWNQTRTAGSIRRRYWPNLRALRAAMNAKWWPWSFRMLSTVR